MINHLPFKVCGPLNQTYRKSLFPRNSSWSLRSRFSFCPLLPRLPGRALFTRFSLIVWWKETNTQSDLKWSKALLWSTKTLKIVFFCFYLWSIFSLRAIFTWRARRTLWVDYKLQQNISFIENSAPVKSGYFSEAKSHGNKMRILFFPYSTNCIRYLFRFLSLSQYLSMLCQTANSIQEGVSKMSANVLNLLRSSCGSFSCFSSELLLWQLGLTGQVGCEWRLVTN